MPLIETIGSSSSRGFGQFGSLGYIKSNLLVNLDAGDVNSYSGSGTTWTNLAGPSYNATFTGSGVTYSSSNNGIITIANAADTLQSNFITLAHSGTNPLNNQNTTIDFSFKYNSYNVYWERIFDFGRGGNNTTGSDISNAVMVARAGGTTDVGLRIHGTLTAQYSLSSAWNMNTWEHWTITWSSSGQILMYKNSQLVQT